MNQSRQALVLSIIYSLPLIIWFVTQLQFIEWSTANLQSLFRQTLFGLFLLQAFTTALLFINHPGSTWQDDALGVTHILLFPLPFLTLIWLTGSVSLSVILKNLALVSSLGIFALLLQQCCRLIPARKNLLQTGGSLAVILMAVIIWNYRQLWWIWLDL